MTPYFTAPERWHGGHYELALELGARSDARLVAALAALWSAPALDGVYLSRAREPSQQQRYTVTAAVLAADHLYGRAHLPNGCTIACGSYRVRGEDGSDWLDLYLPLGSLATAYAVGGYPFTPPDAPRPRWRQTLDAWLAAIGARVYQHVPYRLGLIGMEVSGESSADALLQHGLPARHYPGLLWPERGGITYYPSTE